MSAVMGSDLTHIDEQGRAGMVDVSAKPAVRREAIAEGFLIAAPTTIDRLLAGDVPKGEAIAVARIAGVQGAKRCAELIPLCHPLPIEQVSVSFDRAGDDRIRIEGGAVVIARTGVEMEALTAVSIAALALWDMAKAIDADLRIEGISLVSKTKQA